MSMNGDGPTNPEDPSQWMPSRRVPWGGVPVATSLKRITSATGAEMIVFVLDTPDARLTTFWPPEQVEALARQMLEFLDRPQIVIADLGDLRRETGAG